MATFKAGQRVRVARGWAKEDVPPQEQIAKTNGCFTGILVRRIDFFDEIFFGPNPGDWIMRLDNGIIGRVHSYMLEPVNYDGYEVVAWSECAWNPPHIGAVA